MAIQHSCLRLLILGSCVSRDVLNAAGPAAGISLVDYFARSSLASLALKPLDEPVDLSSIPSDFQRRMVRRDIEKTFFADIGHAAFDLLLIDMIDERFDLYVTPEGTGCTLSNEFLSAGFDCAGGRGRIVRSESPEFLGLWERGWEHFVAQLRAAGMLHRVHVNQVFWARQTAAGESVGPLFSAERIASANRRLDTMYRRMAADLGAGQFLSFPGELMLASDNHRWGLGPFHYVDDYYRHAYRRLLDWQPPADPRPMAAGGAGAPLKTEEWCDYAAWKQDIFTYENLEAALRHGLRADGIHRVFLGAESLDILLQGVAEAGGDGGPLLVAFNGAVSPREGKFAPFFSGLGLARELKLPLLALSDPTLARNGSVPIAWYAGNDSVAGLPAALARIIDHAAAAWGRRPILFGGSGGGFAVLSILPRLQSRAAGLVWNPQTAISEYVPVHVLSYLRAAFPAAAAEIDGAETLSGDAQRAALRAILDGAALDHDATGGRLPAHCQLLYLQNRGDWHVQRHAGPYLRKGRWARLSDHAFRREDGEGATACWLGNWGDGHAGPPREMLAEILASMARGAAADQLAASLDAQHGSGKPIVWFAVDNAEPPAVAVSQRDGQIVAHCRPGAAPAAGDPEYAFYLVKQGKRLAARWYSGEPSASFADVDNDGGLDIVAFVKDSFGNINTARAQVPPTQAASAQQPAWPQELARTVARHSPSSILEFGCQAGQNLQAMRDMMPGVFIAGIDANPDAVSLARESGLNAHVGDESLLSLLPDGAFDIVFAVSALERLPQPENAVRQLARVARRGVYLLAPCPGGEEAGTAPRSYPGDCQELARRMPPGWTCASRPMPAGRGPHDYVFELLPNAGATTQA